MSWNGLLIIDEVKHLDKDGNVIWQNNNIKNTLHTQGEEFVLKALFSSDVEIPENYYFGLDNRSTIALADTLEDVVETEPASSGYERQMVNSVDDFQFEIVGGNWRAKGAVVTFQAIGGSWGPIKNIFLSNQSQLMNPELGALISSAYLGQTVEPTAGESMSLRMIIALKDCA